jgi:hypothetical protein
MQFCRPESLEYSCDILVYRNTMKGVYSSILKSLNYLADCTLINNVEWAVDDPVYSVLESVADRMDKLLNEDHER